MPCPPPPSPTIISRCTITPAHKSTLQDLKLSVSDLPMLSCQYIQKGVLFTLPPIPFHTLIPILKHALSVALTAFPPLAGRLITDSTGFVYLTSNDAGVEFIHAIASNLSLPYLLQDSITDVPQEFKQFFAFDGSISYDGHFKPIAAIQVTELADGVFIGCTVNHAVTDGTSFWNFFNTFAEICRGSKKVTKSPDFTRNFVKDSPAVLKFPDGAPKVTFDVNALRERIFHFSRASILKLKAKANMRKDNGVINGVELIGKQSNDSWKNEKQNGNGNITSVLENWLMNVVSLSENQESEVKDPTAQISSFQSLCAQLWRSVTRARKLPPSKMTTFRMAVNCRHRIEPRIHPLYFGNAIQSIPTVATVDDLLSRDLNFNADLLHHSVMVHDDATVRRGVENWEKDPRCHVVKTHVNESPPWADLESGNPSPRVPAVASQLFLLDSLNNKGFQLLLSPSLAADPEDSGTRANIKKTMHAIMTFGSGGFLAFSQVDARNSSQKFFYYASVTFLGISVLSAAVTRLMVHTPAHQSMKYLSFGFMCPTCLVVLGFLFVLVFVLIRG